MNLSKVEGSPSLEVVNLVLEMKSKGEKVVSLAIGDPSSNTPKEIVDAAYLNMLSSEGTHYVPSYGTRDVREAIRRKVDRSNGIKAEVSNTIFLTTKFSVYAALVAVSEGPYEALLPDPGYFYSEPVILSGGTPVYYELASDFSLDIDEIKRKTTPKTKAILINSPSNPTGRVLEKSELSELYGFCSDRGIHIISDEAYEDLVYDGAKHFAVGSIEPRPNLVVSLFSLSKSYSMTGWRAGYVVASERMIYLINKFLENTVTCFPPFIQKASEYALDHGDRYIQEFRKEYSAKRKIMLERLVEIEEFEPNDIQGAFYAFPKFRTPNMGSVHLCKRILKEQGVALLPGVAFGKAGEGRVRMSFSGSVDVIDDAMNRLRTFFKSSM